MQNLQESQLNWCRRDSADQQAANADERQHARKAVKHQDRAAGSILDMAAEVNKSLNEHQQITQQQVKALQAVAGNVNMLLGLEADKDEALNDDLNSD